MGDVDEERGKKRVGGGGATLYVNALSPRPKKGVSTKGRSRKEGVV